MDQLEITALNVATRIGVYAWEQRISQRLEIDIKIPYDFSACHDNLANTIDYEKLSQSVTAFIEANSFKLIETVAEKVAALIKEQFHIEQLTIRVSKPSAIKNAANTSITLTR